MKQYVLFLASCRGLLGVNDFSNGASDTLCWHTGQFQHLYEPRTSWQRQISVINCSTCSVASGFEKIKIKNKKISQLLMSRRNFQGRFFPPSCRWKYKNVCVLVGHLLQRHTERDEVLFKGTREKTGALLKTTKWRGHSFCSNKHNKPRLILAPAGERSRGHTLLSGQLRCSAKPTINYH